jgi:hypothetical protein
MEVLVTVSETPKGIRIATLRCDHHIDEILHGGYFHN